MSDRAPDPEAGHRPDPRRRPGRGSGADQRWWFRDGARASAAPPSRGLRWPRRTHTVGHQRCHLATTTC